mmetsp:Transcript_22588/g.23264  ORF Transcript_22588/g.23264 Transcript_22588/m.23264 type:complete len:202 (-) Transcript_22588:126-731(-)
MISEEEKRSTPFDEVFAFDRTVSRLLEMQSQDYLRIQYSEWIQRRGSSKDLLTSLLQSESSSNNNTPTTITTTTTTTQFDPTSLSSIPPDEVFIPLFQINELSREILSSVIQENLSTTSLSSSKLVGTILKKTIEKMTGTILEELTTDQINSLLLPSNLNLNEKLTFDNLLKICLSQNNISFLSKDHLFRISFHSSNRTLK